jgi:UDP-glucose 4-epimerase
MSNFLVTGGLGFVGSHLTEELYNAGHEVTVLDNLSNGHLNNLSH